MVKWFCFQHFRQVFPNAGHSSRCRLSCCRPQLGQYCVRSCMFLIDVAGVRAFTPSSSTSFSSMASVCLCVSAGSRKSCSLVLTSLIPNTRRSRSSSSEVMDPKSQFSASLRKAVRYWSYVSPGSCERRLKRYRSKGMFLHGYISRLIHHKREIAAVVYIQRGWQTV